MILLPITSANLYLLNNHQKAGLELWRLHPHHSPWCLMLVVEVDISPNKGERNLQPVWRSHFDLTALVNIKLRYIVTGQNISRQIFIYTQYWNHNIVLIANIANVFCSQYFPLTLLPNQNQLALNSCCAAAVLRWILRSKEDRIFLLFWDRR